MWVWSLGWEHPLEKEMATHSSIHAWRIPQTEERGRLQSMGLPRVGRDWSDLALSRLSNLKVLLERSIVLHLELRVSDEDLGLMESLSLEATGWKEVASFRQLCPSGRYFLLPCSGSPEWSIERGEVLPKGIRSQREETCLLPSRRCPRAPCCSPVSALLDFTLWSNG